MPGAGEADISSSSQAELEVPRNAFAAGSLASSSRGFEQPHPTLPADAASLLETRPRPRLWSPACTDSASSPEQQAAASEQAPMATATTQGPISGSAATGVAAGHLASRLSEMAVSRDEDTLECSTVGDAAIEPAEGTVQQEVDAGNSVAVGHQSTVWGSGSGAAVDGLREGSPCRTGSLIEVRGPLQSQIVKSH